jgi:hypothetical protein
MCILCSSRCFEAMFTNVWRNFWWDSQLLTLIRPLESVASLSFCFNCITIVMMGVSCLWLFNYFLDVPWCKALYLDTALYLNRIGSVHYLQIVLWLFWLFFALPLFVKLHAILPWKRLFQNIFKLLCSLVGRILEYLFNFTGRSGKS